jgi:hypothetical protein
VAPVQEAVEGLQAELDARAKIGPLEGWAALVVKAAFIQGCNMDLLTISAMGSPRLRSATAGSASATKYNDLVDKIYARRIPEVCHAHIYPVLNLVTEEAVMKAADRVGSWYDREEFGETRFGFDEFYKIVVELRKMQEAGEFGVGGGGGGGDEVEE